MFPIYSSQVKTIIWEDIIAHVLESNALKHCLGCNVVSQDNQYSKRVSTLFFQELGKIHMSPSLKGL